MRENVRLTSRDVAVYCQVSRSTVLQWIKSGRLKAFSLPSGHYRVESEDFREFLEKWQMPVKSWLFGKGDGDAGATGRGRGSAPGNA